VHKPKFNSDIQHAQGFLKESYEIDYHKVIEKWENIALGVFKGIKITELNNVDKKMLLFYTEWLWRHDDNDDNDSTYNNTRCKGNSLIENIREFEKILIDYINSPSMNFTIVNKVYNPLLNKVRYEVQKGNKQIIMDEFTYKEEALLISLYPNEFLVDIGMKGYVRNNKLKSILTDDVE